MTGSISCYKACFLASLAVQDGYELQAVASQGALKFIGPATFEGLTGRPLLTDMWRGAPDYLPHITLSQKWADLILVYPATANCINRLAAGLADDLFGALFLANNFHKPVWIAPAMNSEMFAHPAVRESLEKLARWGAEILPTEEGKLACGTVGKGRLTAPEKVLERIRAVL
jgi:phosphopantothenoylcysteine decarboxylase/phosphopantothenate--cysteine ligase